MTSLAGVLLLLALAVDPGAAVSGETAVPASGSVLNADLSLAPLWSALRAEEHPDRLWYRGWAGFFGVAVVGESVIAAGRHVPRSAPRGPLVGGVVDG